jgi:hypothetical protein
MFYGILVRMHLGIIDVKPLSDYRLELTFENEGKRIFDVKPYLHLGTLSVLDDKKCFRLGEGEF